MCCASRAGGRDVTLLATGSEVEIALAARRLLLAAQGLKRRRRLHALLGAVRGAAGGLSRQRAGRAPRVAVEAAVRLGWDRWIGERGAFVGMTGFGASAPADALYKHFGITAEAVADAAEALL